MERVQALILDDTAASSVEYGLLIAGIAPGGSGLHHGSRTGRVEQSLFPGSEPLSLIFDQLPGGCRRPLGQMLQHFPLPCGIFNFATPRL
jgi:hypothetical protein